MNTQKARLIELALKQFLPNANIKTKPSKTEGLVENVTATIQGPFAGSILKEITDATYVVDRDYSIYRSGTGLTIRYI